MSVICHLKLMDTWVISFFTFIHSFVEVKYFSCCFFAARSLSNLSWCLVFFPIFMRLYGLTQGVSGWAFINRIYIYSCRKIFRCQRAIRIISAFALFCAEKTKFHESRELGETSTPRLGHYSTSLSGHAKNTQSLAKKNADSLCDQSTCIHNLP